MSDDRTIGFYDARADDYARTVEDQTDPMLARFMAGAPTGGHLLDLGCGPGHAAAVMAGAGFRVTACDASAEMVRLASAMAGVTARQARFDALDDVAAYDGIWASYSLLHAPRAALPGRLAAVHRALTPGGLFCIGMKLGTGEKIDSLGRFYSYYGESELEDLLGAAGFEVTDRHLSEIRGMSGQLEAGITVFAHG
ncbi:class I SAM-dependent DNA methyltransferase [Marinibacterium sp. SX1]|uniref:class I SAM-dependent DNA methyltransferase n=1 Tax=Marinibacterium sp. SX1 TaxID=3388424 RepID=UPI003D162D4D